MKREIRLSEVISRLEEKGLHKSAENVKRVVGIDSPVDRKAGEFWGHIASAIDLLPYAEKQAKNVRHPEVLNRHLKVLKKALLLVEKESTEMLDTF